MKQLKVISGKLEWIMTKSKENEVRNTGFPYQLPAV